jgi:hypothetical protein
MQAYRSEATITQDGSLTVKGLPFRAGERVEVIVLQSSPQAIAANCYPLRGTPLRYDQPTAPVAESDWEAS